MESRPQPHFPMPVEERLLTTYAEEDAKLKDKGQELQRKKVTKGGKRVMAAASPSIANKKVCLYRLTSRTAVEARMASESPRS